MIVKTNKSCDTYLTQSEKHLCIPLFIRALNRATIEWEWLCLSLRLGCLI